MMLARSFAVVLAGATLLFAAPLAASDPAAAKPAASTPAACCPTDAPAAKDAPAACCPTDAPASAPAALASSPATSPASAAAPTSGAPMPCCPMPGAEPETTEAAAAAPAATSAVAATTVPATVERDASGLLTVTVPSEADAAELATDLGFNLTFDNPYDDAPRKPYVATLTPQEIATLNTAVGPFELVDQDGTPFTQDLLAGRAWIIDFIFTRCSGPCPAMSATMARLVREARAEQLDVAFVTVSVDPDYDTPAVMKRYAGWFGATPDTGWHFLTGDYRTIYALANDVLGVGLKKYGGHHDAEQFPGRLMADPIPEVILHSQRFVLVDAQGLIRGFYEGSEPAETERLLRDLRTMAPAR